jgi:small subunit ribosomal protein S6
MQGYESIVILDPNLTEEQQTQLLDKFKGIVEGQGGKVVQQARWGRRRLAYEVKKRDYGIYHLFYLDHAPKALKALEHQFRFEENVLKWISVKVEDVESEHAAFEKLRTQGSAAQSLSER